MGTIIIGGIGISLLCIIFVNQYACEPDLYYASWYISDVDSTNEKKEMFVSESSWGTD